MSQSWLDTTTYCVLPEIMGNTSSHFFLQLWVILSTLHGYWSTMTLWPLDSNAWNFVALDWCCTSMAETPYIMTVRNSFWLLGWGGLVCYLGCLDSNKMAKIEDCFHYLKRLLTMMEGWWHWSNFLHSSHVSFKCTIVIISSNVHALS